MWDWLYTKFERKCDFENLHPQRFSIPSTIIYYITKNLVSPSTHQKLIQSCKHFFAKNPIIVIDRIMFYFNDFIIVENKACISFNYSCLSRLQICLPYKFWVIKTASLDSLCHVALEVLRENMFRINELHLHSYIVDPEQIFQPEVLESIQQVNYLCKWPW